MASGPWAVLIAFCAVLALVLVMRWAFRPSRSRPATRPVDAADSPDLGLLTVVAAGLDRDDAMRRRAVLGEADIRSSMSRRRDGKLDVLVFHADEATARILLGP